MVAFRRSNEASWIKLCEEVETDPWGLPYTLVTKKLIEEGQLQGFIHQAE